MRHVGDFTPQAAFQAKTREESVLSNQPIGKTNESGGIVKSALPILP